MTLDNQNAMQQSPGSNQEGGSCSGASPCYQRALPGMESAAARDKDIIYTPDAVAKDVIDHFKPSGRILDPCRGLGAFWKHIPGAEWCEIHEGRDFFEWGEPMDWIISNPPYSVFTPFLKHSMEIAPDIVYLIPVQKAFISRKIMRTIWGWGGVPEIYVCGDGADLTWDIGFCIGAVHFQKDYRGGTHVTFRDG